MGHNINILYRVKLRNIKNSCKKYRKDFKSEVYKGDLVYVFCYNEGWCLQHFLGRCIEVRHDGFRIGSNMVLCNRKQGVTQRFDVYSNMLLDCFVCR